MPKETFFNLPDEKRERFIQLAIEEFADHDYANASISRLVARMGIAKGSFYQYFEDKKDLFLYLVFLGQEEKQEMLGRIELPRQTDNLFDYLRALFRLQVQYELRHPRLAEVGYRALFRDLPFQSELLEQLKTQGRVGIRHLLAQGVADGSVDPEVDLDLAAFVVTNLFAEFGRYLMERLEVDAHRFMRRDLTADDWALANESYDQLLHILQHGLGARREGVG